MSKVSVQIVTWNSINYIGECLDALAGQIYTNFGVLVIDNASNDQTVEFVRGNFPTVAVLENFKNTGYSKANNQGIRLAKSEYVLVMNPDVVLEPDFLEILVKFADEHPEAGSFCGKTYKLRSQILDDHNDESGLRESIKTDIIDSTGLVMHKSRKEENRGEGQNDEGQFERAEEIFGASGACVLYRKEALDEVMINHETFDQDFFAYKEDVDLAWRLQLYGWQSWYNPGSIAYHHRGLPSSGGKQMKKIIKHRREVSKFLRSLSYRNHKLMLVKNDQFINIVLASPWLAGREIASLFYVVFFEPFLFKSLAQFFKLLPKALLKRKIIMAHRKVTPSDIRRWFV